MKIIKIDLKTKEIILIPNTIEDLWHLEKIIEKDDVVFGKTDRKIKPKNEGEKAIRIKLFVELLVENVFFQEFNENLKISGVIINGKPQEHIELKSHQSIDIKTKEKIKIIKNQLKNWQIERLKKAEKESVASKLLVILIDDESAELAFINQFSINKKGHINSNKSGKMYSQEKNDYFEKIQEKILQLDPKKIVLAGPGFTKENFQKYLEEKRIKGFPKIILENLNSTGETGFRELINTQKLEKIEKTLQLSKEGKLIEEFLEKLSKEKADYGKEKIFDLINLGAIDKLIVSEKYLIENRNEIENILNLGEKFGCEINIISSKNSQEKIIYGMGGVVATLRYKVN